MPPLDQNNTENHLISRNITINGHRTSIRLESHMWDAFDEVCAREELSPHNLTTMIDEGRNGASRTAAVRAFIVSYFRAAATEEGHRNAGHGTVTRETRPSMSLAANA